MRSSSSGGVGQVYQPTTTTLPPHRSSHKPWVPHFVSAGAGGVSGSPWSRGIMLVLSTLFAIMGMIMIIVGAMSYSAQMEWSKEGGDDGGGGGSTSAYVIILCLGVLLVVTSIAIAVMYFRTIGYYIPCCPGKIARIRKRLHHNQMVVNGQMVNVQEPVSAQYCPPAAPTAVGNTPPPPYTDTSEHQRLMEEKPDVGGEDTALMLEEDPRIVLNPGKSREDC